VSISNEANLEKIFQYYLTYLEDGKCRLGSDWAKQLKMLDQELTKMEGQRRQKEGLNKELREAGSLWFCFSPFHLTNFSPWVYI